MSNRMPEISECAASLPSQWLSSPGHRQTESGFLLPVRTKSAQLHYRDNCSQVCLRIRETSYIPTQRVSLYADEFFRYRCECEPDEARRHSSGEIPGMPAHIPVELLHYRTSDNNNLPWIYDSHKRDVKKRSSMRRMSCR